MKKKRKLKKSVLGILICSLLLCSGYIVVKAVKNQTLYTKASEALDTLFVSEELIYEDVKEEDVNNVLYLIDQVRDSSRKEEMQIRLQSVIDYMYVRDSLKEILQDNVLKSSVTSEELQQIIDKYDTLEPGVQTYVMDDLQSAKEQRKAIDEALDELNHWIDQDGVVKEEVDREIYEHILEMFKALPQEDVLSDHQSKIDAVLNKIKEKEQKYQEQLALEEQRRIKEGTHMLYGIPIINQLEERVYNGCEAASLLMGLKYKGYASDWTLPLMASDMPKSDDPHKGFVSDIFNYAPRDRVHWIAPDALAAYGRKFYSGVYDISGASVEQLKAEIDAGNPVVVYGTDYYAEPGARDGEVFMNLHVQLMVGYNSYLNTIILNDPGHNEMSIPGNQFEYIYNHLRFAVVIR